MEVVYLGEHGRRWRIDLGGTADLEIRRLQGYVKSQALAHGVPVIPNHSFDQTIATVIDLVMDKATSQAAEVSAELASAGASRTTQTPQQMTNEKAKD